MRVTACTQSSFKTAKKAFLFVGMQGGRYKAMFKLERSIPQATRLAEKEPDRYEVGSTVWVTTRFTAEQPLPAAVWEKWLDESYELSRASGPRKRTAKKTAAKKKAPKKKAVTAARAARSQIQTRGSR